MSEKFVKRVVEEIEEKKERKMMFSPGTMDDISSEHMRVLFQEQAWSRAVQRGFFTASWSWLHSEFWNWKRSKLGSSKHQCLRSGQEVPKILPTSYQNFHRSFDSVNSLRNYAKSSFLEVNNLPGRKANLCPNMLPAIFTYWPWDITLFAEVISHLRACKVCHKAKVH